MNDIVTEKRINYCIACWGVVSLKDDHFDFWGSLDLFPLTVKMDNYLCDEKPDFLPGNRKH